MKLGEVVVEGKVAFKQVSVQSDLAAPELYEEVSALLRFWRRRAYYAFAPCDAPNGESDYSIDFEHLAFALSKVKHYQSLLDSRDITPERDEHRRDRVETPSTVERRGRG
jgi:hypothetical protein